MKRIIQNATKESDIGKTLSDKEFGFVVEKIKRKISVPKKLPNYKIIFCPIGLVGAGKTTVTKPISKKLGLVQVSSDEIRRILQKYGYNYTRTVELVKHVVKDYLSSGHSLAVDGDAIAPDIRQYLKRLAKKEKAKIIFVHVKPPEKFIINKLTNYKHTWLFKDADDALNNYKRRKSLHKQYLRTINFYHKFDTSKDDIKEQIDKFIAKIKTDYNV